MCNKGNFLNYYRISNLPYVLTFQQNSNVLAKSGKTLFLTNGAVGAHPVGVAAAKPRVSQVGAVPAALVGALGSGQLTVHSSPARAA